jgi:hypothetical protein
MMMHQQQQLKCIDTGALQAVRLGYEQPEGAYVMRHRLLSPVVML